MLGPSLFPEADPHQNEADPKHCLKEKRVLKRNSMYLEGFQVILNFISQNHTF